MVKLSTLTHIVLELNAAIDTGHHSDISVQAIYDQIEARNALQWVQEQCGRDIDLSLILNDLKSVNFINEHLLEIYGGYAGRHRRKWGVEKSGLCLLLGWIIEIIQRGDGWRAPKVIDSPDSSA